MTYCKPFSFLMGISMGKYPPPPFVSNGQHTPYPPSPLSWLTH